MAEFQRDEHRSFRTAFVLLSLLFAAVTAWAIVDETWLRRPWKVPQEAYARLKPPGAVPVAIAQIVVPELAVVDRCPTCHAGIDDPAMVGAQIPRVLRVHPQRETLLRQHPVARFGCTPCHHGQGLALTVETAHGDGDPHWPEPLLRGPYVQASCLGCHALEPTLAGAPVISRGRQLFHELGCGGCHLTGLPQPEPKRGPSLRHVAAKLQPGYLLAWIRAPQVRRPHHRMPQFWPEAAHDPQAAAQRDRESLAIAAYALSVSEPLPLAEHAPPVDPQRAAAGQRLFDRVGCRGCHMIDGGAGDLVRIREEKPAAAGDAAAWDSFGGDADAPAAATAVTAPAAIDFAPALGELAARVQPGFVYAWLLDPAQYWPDATMPTPRLTPSEAHAVASWLLSLATTAPPPPPPELAGAIDPALAQAGKQLVARYGCFGCHDIGGFAEEPRPGPDLTDFATKDPRDLVFGASPPPLPQRTWTRFTEAKLRAPRALATPDTPLVMPHWPLPPDDVTALAVFLRGLRATPLPEAYRYQPPRATERQLAEQVLAERGCQQCHKLDAQPPAIARYYDDAHLAPPQLVGAGARLRPQWLFDYLLQPGALRPWLEARMPQFRLSPPQAAAVAALLAERAGLPPGPRPLAVPPLTVERAHVGAALFERLRCVTCHQLQAGEGVASAQLAPDLALARQRLDPAWVRKFLEDPAKMLPGTHMPQFFPDGQTPAADVLDGNAAAQLDLLVDYLMNLGLVRLAPAPTETTP